jgi:hypothetical protein
MREDAVLALQRTLMDAALMPDPAPLERDPGGFAAQRGLPRGDQEAFVRFKDRLLVYRNMVRGDLVEPLESICYVTRALMEQAGLWEECQAAFLASRGVQSAFYRDLSATFLGWLAATGWGQDRWPFLLQLVHFEVLTALVSRHPGSMIPPGLRPAPRLGDRLVLAAPTQVVTYQHRVHLSTVAAPAPAPGTVHLLAYRDREGYPQWMELTPATAALLLGAQAANIGQAAMDLGLTDLTEAMELLAQFQAKGAIAGFTPDLPLPGRPAPSAA